MLDVKRDGEDILKKKEKLERIRNDIKKGKLRIIVNEKIEDIEKEMFERDNVKRILIKSLKEYGIEEEMDFLIKVGRE